MSARLRQKAALETRTTRVLGKEFNTAGAQGEVIKLQSFSVPALPAANYTVSVTQEVKLKDSVMPIMSFPA